MKIRQHGFTRNELLVVLIAFVLLLLLSVPALQKRQQVAHRLTCVSHLKVLAGQAWMFASDHKGTFPGRTNESYWLVQADFPNLPDNECLRCPADKGSSVWPTNCNSVFGAMGTSYAFAWTGLPHAGVSGLFDTNGPIRFSDERLAMSSRKIIFFEPPLNEDNPASDPRTKWHFVRRGSGAALLDGHAEFFLTNYTTLPDAVSVTNRWYF